MNVLHGASGTFSESASTAGIALGKSLAVVSVGAKDPRDVVTMRQDVATLQLLVKASGNVYAFRCVFTAAGCICCVVVLVVDMLTSCLFLLR
jgi:hypothetical protein